MKVFIKAIKYFAPLRWNHKVPDSLKDVELDDGDYTMDHTATVYLLDARGKFSGSISYGEDGKSAVAKLRKLLKS